MGHVVKLILIFILATISLWLNTRLANVGERTSVERNPYNHPLESYSFIGRDYPDALPLSTRAVRMLVEESIHFSITDSEAADEWLWTAPVGDNHVRLGPDQRLFTVAMFHELHCLRNIRAAMVLPASTRLHIQTLGHINHCLNYLREWTLCNADVTLEPGDFTQRNFSVDQVGTSHTCTDWMPLYKLEEKNWLEWKEYRESHNLSFPRS